MYIDTKSQDSIKKSLCYILNVNSYDIDDLMKDCYDKLEANQYLDLDDQYEYFKEYIKDHLIYSIDEIEFIHLSRRLDNDNYTYNFKDVFIKETSLSKYLRSYGITFTYDQHMKMYIKGNEQDIKQWNSLDSSIGGYAFMDKIEKSDGYNNAIGGPEFFGHLYLYDIDDDVVIDEYINNTHFYLFEYVIPLKDIEFESYEDLNEEEKMYHMIIIALQRLYFHKYDPMFNEQENQVLKVCHNKILDAKYLVNKKDL